MVKDGRDSRCEEIMRRAADAYPDLFESLVHIIGGQQVEDHLGADTAVVLQPLPKVPVMLCYWSPDDGLDSKLTLLFDRTVKDNLPNRGIFYHLHRAGPNDRENVGETRGVYRCPIGDAQ